MKNLRWDVEAVIAARNLYRESLRKRLSDPTWFPVYCKMVGKINEEYQLLWDSGTRDNLIDPEILWGTRK